MDSFYGGKQGISPVIKARFKFIDTNDFAFHAAAIAWLSQNENYKQLSSNLTAVVSASGKVENLIYTNAGVETNLLEDGTEKFYQAIAANAEDINIIYQALKSDTMDLSFADTSYEGVWYGELCLINSDSKENPNHGKLFRRTLKRKGDTGINRCAEYVGLLAGPMGQVPSIEITSLEENDRNARTYESETDLEGNHYQTNMFYANQETIARVNESLGDEEELHRFGATSAEDITVPARTGNETDGYVYNDNILFSWYNFVDRTAESRNGESGAYLKMGLQVPAFEADFSAVTSPWNKQAKFVKGEEYDSHMFWKPWDVDIPVGEPGSGIAAIKCFTVQELLSSGSYDYIYSLENLSLVKYRWNGQRFERTDSSAIVDFDEVRSDFNYLKLATDCSEQEKSRYVVYDSSTDKNQDGTLKNTSVLYKSLFTNPQNPPTEEEIQATRFYAIELSLPAYDDIVGEDYSPNTMWFFLNAVQDIRDVYVDHDTESSTFGEMVVFYADGQKKTLGNLLLPKSASVNELDGTMTFVHSGDKVFNLTKEDGTPFSLQFIKDYSLVGDVDDTNEAESRSIKGTWFGKSSDGINPDNIELGSPINYIQELYYSQTGFNWDDARLEDIPGFNAWLKTIEKEKTVAIVTLYDGTGQESTKTNIEYGYLIDTPEEDLATFFELTFDDTFVNSLNNQRAEVMRQINLDLKARYGTTLNWDTIEKCNYHLFVLFNDPLHRQVPKKRVDGEDVDLTDAERRAAGYYLTKELPGLYNGNISLENTAYWLDLGPTRQVDSGLYLYTDIDLTGYSLAEVISQLNNGEDDMAVYKEGLSGRAVNVRYLDDKQGIFAYDYVNKTWFLVGTYDSTGTAILDKAFPKEQYKASSFLDVNISHSVGQLETGITPSSVTSIPTVWR